MSVKEDLLCDVDGVVANLMDGFNEWFHRKTYNKFPGFDAQLFPLFDIRRAARSPQLVEIDDALRKGVWWPYLDGDGGINGAFMEFMHTESAYDFVPLVDGAEEGFAAVQERFNVVFVTAVMDAAPEHIPSKFRWLNRNFPSVPIFTAPSKLKSMIKGKLGVDDRYDTCQRWKESGTEPFLFKQAWNEAPEGYLSYDWSNLPGALISYVDNRST